MLQAEPFTNAAADPAEAGYNYVMPANVNPAEKETWKKSETDAAASKCLHVNSVSRQVVLRRTLRVKMFSKGQDVQPSTKVREGRCMVNGARSGLRMLRLVNTPVADEYEIRSSAGGCWQPEPEASAGDAATADDGVSIISVSSASSSSAVLQRWRI